MYYAVSYNQLRGQVHRVHGKKANCVIIEDGDAVFPDVADITLILGNEVQSQLILLRAAKEFPGKINVVNLNGEFTNLSPLAVSDTELKECCKTPHCISERERCALIEEYDNLPNSPYYQLQDGHIAPLSQENITTFILQQIAEPMRISVAVGRCMGYSPKGWPRTDSFYLQQIQELSENGVLAIVGSDSDVMQNFVRPLNSL